MPLCPGCLKGGGRDDCEIWACALSKNLADCSECDQPDRCENQDLLETMQKGAQKTGLMVKTEDISRQELLKKWTEELKSQWPSLLLFQDA